jgi:hypothetical protein
MIRRSLTSIFGPRSACVAGAEYIERRLDEVLRRRSRPPALLLPPAPAPRTIELSVDEEPASWVTAPVTQR